MNRDFLRNLPNLQVLEVFLPDQFDFDLDGPANLKWLNLRKISDINVSIFKPLSDQIVVLNLSNNTIDNSLAEKLFENLRTPFLTYLHLGRNNLSCLNGSWFARLDSLKELVLESNQIDEIKLNNSLAGLEVLDLHGNCIEVIHEDTFKPLKSLRVLYLGDNPIKTLETNSFRSLQQLENLYLVSLRNDEFNRISDCFFDGLKSLSLLKLNFNSLSFIEPNGFFGLHNLKELDLSRNQIQLDTAMFSQLTGLKKLDLSRNGIVTIPDNAFLSLTSLERLNLAYNRLAILTNTASFSGLVSLRDLDLSFNVLLHVDVDILACLVKLEKVNFRYNPLENYDRIAKAMNDMRIVLVI